jgi:hypothetical protein
MSLLIYYRFNKVFVIVFDFIDVFPVLTEHLLLPPFRVKLESVCLLYAHLHIINFVCLPPRLVDLRNNAFLFKLEETYSIGKMQLIFFY